MNGSSIPFQRIWVFSDLHLSDPRSDLYRAFLAALDEPDSSSDAVVLAGDIFEIFVGNSPYFIEKNADFFTSLRKLTERHVSIFYIQGNHDFHLQKAFDGLNVTILDAELVLGKIYIAHGDLVDEDDRGYLWLRKFFRSSFIRGLADLIPGKAVKWIGESIARTHEEKMQDTVFQPAEVPRVRQVFRKYAELKKSQGFDFVILGHCHDLDDLQPFYFNMGYPPVHRQFLYWSAESNSFKRRIFAGIQP